MKSSPIEVPPEVPLVVDLDGTLLRADLLYESAIRLLRQNPFYILLLPFWLLAGKHVLKRELARRVHIDVSRLPCNDGFLSHLRGELANGRTLVLATASHQILARAVFNYHGFFHELMSTDDNRNLSGARKRDALVSRFGEKGFDYAGNAGSDLAIWRSARKSIVVNPHVGVESRARALGNVEHLFVDRLPRFSALLRSLRLHQWAKNFLVFVPLLAAHLWNDSTAVSAAFATFLAFCLCASSIYQINDMLDLDADRAHPRKRLRPIASGNLSIPAASASALLLMTGGLLLAASVSTSVASLLMLYVAATCAYSLTLKSRPLIDLVALASLYTVRIIAGAAAVEVVPSFWLLAFSMFLFLSLATLKRCAELKNAPQGAGPSGRGYLPDDQPYLTGFGAGAGVGSVVILALFVNSAETASRYARPEFLWLLCPLLIYWTGRMWLMTGRGQMHDDPVVFAAKDPVSLTVGLLGMGLIAVAL